MPTEKLIREAPPDQFKVNPQYSRKNIEGWAMHMAISFLEIGQIAPIILSRAGYIVDGHIRHRAAQLVRQGFDVGGKIYEGDPNFQLKYIVQR